MPQGRPATTKRPELGERIVSARQKAGLTQQQLAEQMGTSQRVVTYWEREAVTLKPEQLLKLSSILDVSVDELMGRRAAKKRNNGPTGKARQIFEQVSRLPRSQQQRILATVEDLLLAQNARQS